MTDLIRTPWTSEQVTTLNAFQQQGGMHPFTCGALHASGQSPLLDATHSGWICPDPACEYTQDWAHAFMADPSTWPAAFAGVAPATNEAELACCSDPTCTCVQVNADGLCECVKWDAVPPADGETERRGRYAAAIRDESSRVDDIAIADAVMAVADAEQEALRAEVDRLRTQNARMRHELEVMYGGAFDEPPAAVPADDRAEETDEQRADRLETERDHSAGDHQYCGVTCEVEMPTEHLRNFVIAKGYPGTKGALDELLRRARTEAAAVPAVDRAGTLAAVLRQVLSGFRAVSNEGVAPDAEVLAFTGPTVSPQDYHRWCDEVQIGSHQPPAVLPDTSRAAVLRELIAKAEEWDGHITVQELRRMADGEQP